MTDVSTLHGPATVQIGSRPPPPPPGPVVGAYVPSHGTDPATGATLPLNYIGTGVSPPPVTNQLYVGTTVISVSSLDRATLNKTSTKAAPTQETIAGNGSVPPIVYGLRRVGAMIAGALVYQGALYLIAVWCKGPVQGVQSYTVADLPPAGGVQATHYDGTQTTPDPWIATAVAGGTTGPHGTRGPGTYTDALTGWCYSVVKIPATASPSFPTLAAIVEGRKVALTSGGTPTYSTVPAYCIADFITSPATSYGMGMKVNWTDVAALASYNTAMIGSPAEVRNDLNVMLDTPQLKQTWLAVLCDYAGCVPVLEGDTYRLFIDEVGSSVMSLGAGDIVEGSLQLAVRDVPDWATVVQCRYTDTTYIPWQDANATAYADGVEAGTTRRRVSQIAKPGILRYSEAYRYALQRLNDGATSRVIATFTMFDQGIQLQPGCIIDITHPIGLSADLYRVSKSVPSSPGRWAVTANKYDAGKYSTAVVSGPTTSDTSLPSPLIVPDVIDFDVVEQVDQIQTGRFISRLNFTWDGPTLSEYPLLAGYDLVITGLGASQTFNLPSDSSSFLTDALPEGVTWNCQLRARSSTTPGAYALVQITNIGKASIPSDVASIAGFSTNGLVTLTWPKVPDLDVTAYELRLGTSSDTWTSAALLADVPAPATAYSTIAVPPGARRFFVKAVDSVRSPASPNGQQSANAAYIDLTVTANNAWSYTTYDGLAGGATLTNMSAMPPGGWVTDMGDTWASLFPLAMTNYPNPLATYHTAAASGIAGGTIDAGSLLSGATIVVAPSFTNLDGGSNAQVKIRYKTLIGDAWTVAAGPSVTAGFRYCSVEVISNSNTDTFTVASLGTVSIGVAV